MSIKNIAIYILMIYALVSPILIIESESSGYTKGFNKGYDIAVDNIQQTSPLYHYKIGDVIKSNHQYFITFNESVFVGKIKFIGSDGVLIINGITDKDLELHDMVINEFWTELAKKGD